MDKYFYNKYIYLEWNHSNYMKNKIDKKNKRFNKKKRVIELLFKECNKKNNYEFGNDLVNKICKKVGFKNQFDVTKLDNKTILPKLLTENDYAIIHTGSGNHKFIKGIDKVYHNFEKIEKEIEWNYNKSLLNNFNTSESNLLSVANNQRILHNFLFGKDTEFDDKNISKRPKTYFPHRTKTSFEYNFGNDIKVCLKNIQLEIDLTIEFEGNVGIFEGKNGKPDSFSIYQIYHPFLYYYLAKTNFKIDIKNIKCVYVVREKSINNIIINLYAYTFSNPIDITTIQFLKSASYKLIN